MMTNEGGHYCSKKSDDICGDVCGQVFFLFFLFSIFFVLYLDFCKTENPIHRIVDLLGSIFCFLSWVLGIFGFWENVGKKTNFKILDLGFSLLYTRTIKDNYFGL